jgi:hypothetical protein
MSQSLTSSLHLDKLTHQSSWLLSTIMAGCPAVTLSVWPLIWELTGLSSLSFEAGWAKGNPPRSWRRNATWSSNLESGFA